MPRVALGISYDGRPWQGWQKQPNGQTVQDALERALAVVATVPVQTTCAGRTDTAVHALGQVVHFILVLFTQHSILDPLNYNPDHVSEH